MSVPDAPALPPAAGAPVFDLVNAFAGSADARLRGNAAHALAAIASRGDTPLRQRALDELAALLAAMPGDASTEWQRQLTERALGAVQQLTADERDALRSQLSTYMAHADDPVRRAWIARFLLAAAEPPARFEGGGWWRVTRLIWLAGRPPVWGSLWAALWRSTVVWAPLWVVASSFNNVGSITTLTVWTTLFIALLAVGSLAGRLTPPLSVRFGDVLLAGALFALLVLGARTMAPEMTAGAPMPPFVIGQAILTGMAVRSLRWLCIAVEAQPAGFEAPLRVLAALLTQTLVSQCAILVGAPVRPVAMAWLLLAPSAAILAWIDVWLERQGPQLLKSRRRQRHPALLPVAVVTMVLLILLAARMHPLDRLLIESRTPIELPAGLRDQPTLEIQTRVNTPVPVKVTEAGRYTWRGSEPEGQPQLDNVLIFTTEGHKVLQSVDGPEPPTFTIDLQPGNYYVCIALNHDKGCLILGRGDLYGLNTIGGVLMLALEGHQRLLTIKASGSDSPPGTMDKE